MTDSLRKDPGRLDNLDNMVFRGHQILNFNQSLIQFADTKAGTLITINSIFLASITSFSMDSKFLLKFLPFFLFFIISCASIFFCLAVVVARSDTPQVVKRKDLVFFGSISSRPNPENYIYDFFNISDRLYCEDLLRRNYMGAQIAQKKFSFVMTAQKLTVFASILWLVNLFYIYLMR